MVHKARDESCPGDVFKSLRCKAVRDRVRQHGAPRAPLLKEIAPLQFGNGAKHLLGGFSDKAAEDRKLGPFTIELLAFKGVNERAHLRDGEQRSIRIKPLMKE